MLRIASWLLAGIAVATVSAGAAMAADAVSCAKPASPAERTICGSADLKLAAEDIATSLRSLTGNTPVAERDGVQRAQQAFLAERDRVCADKSGLQACQRLHERRVAELQSQDSAAQKRVGAIAAGIPKDAKAAAAALQRYDGAAAKAWLVYLYHSGAVPVADRESAERALVGAVIDRDLPPDRELAEEMRNLGDVAAAPLATALLFLRHVLSTTELEAPCFLFTRHGQPAFEAFGAFWGNSRDDSPALCRAPSSVYDMPEWKKVAAHIDPVLEPALEERGSIRLGYERQFDVDDLQASLVPSTLLESPMSPDARRAAEQRQRAIALFRNWKDFGLWREADYKATLAALPAAVSATAKLYRERFGMNGPTAEQAAKAAADRFIAGRLALLLPEE
ncbi:lysozyme inhibitor LprI family protein [Azospirillum thermophilum]|nr:lysozyme inhibitor LprI family protein [Azospirillum thermophilum]